MPKGLTEEEAYELEDLVEGFIEPVLRLSGTVMVGEILSNNYKDVLRALRLYHKKDGGVL